MLNWDVLRGKGRQVIKVRTTDTVAEVVRALASDRTRLIRRRSTR